MQLRHLSLISLAFAACLSISQAATVLVTPTEVAISGSLSPLDLTALGTADWRIYSNAVTGQTGGTRNSSNSLTGLIGPAVNLNTAPNGLVAVNNLSLSYSNGVSPVSEAGISDGFYSRASNGTGDKQVDLQLGGADSGTVQFLVVGYQGFGAATADVSASLFDSSNNLLTLNVANFSYGGTEYDGLYTITFSGANAGDYVRLGLTNTVSQDYNNYLGVAAVALATNAVPEPSIYALLLGAVGLLALSVKQRKFRN